MPGRARAGRVSGGPNPSSTATPTSLCSKAAGISRNWCCGRVGALIVHTSPVASPHVDRNVIRCYEPYLAPGTEECDGHGPRASPDDGAFVAAIVQFPDEADCKIRIQGGHHRFSDPLLLVIGPVADVVELQRAQAQPA